MTATTGRTVMLSLVLVAAFAAAIVFSITYVKRERSVEPKTEAKTEPRTEAKPATATTPTVTPPASRAQDESSAALATVQAEAKAVTSALAEPPRSPDADKSVPTFDITRVEQTGDAVIAGRAAPGATVELLRDGKPLDRAVADQSGQFVMIPPPLPPGNYDLTLRSRLPDGTQVTSEQKMAVAIDAAESGTAAVRPRPEAPADVPETAMANRSVPDQATGSAQVPAPSATKGARSAIVVSRGDSLWRISRATYGSGELYPMLLKANRNQIRDPDLIYPGQSFVLPKQAR